LHQEECPHRKGGCLLDAMGTAPLRHTLQKRLFSRPVRISVADALTGVERRFAPFGRPQRHESALSACLLCACIAVTWCFETAGFPRGQKNSCRAPIRATVGGQMARIGARRTCVGNDGDLAGYEMGVNETLGGNAPCRPICLFSVHGAPKASRLVTMQVIVFFRGIKSR